jgi:Kef-type K+ transport system membrane component KefB
VTLAGVLVAGFCTDAIGIHSIFGAFLLGLVIPKQGPFAEILVEKLEDFITILFLPLYFAVSGLKTNIGTIHGGRSVGLLVLVISVACVGKILGTFGAAKLSNLNFNKSITLGVLMNTKGLVELIVLNIGLARGVREQQKTHCYLCVCFCISQIPIANYVFVFAHISFKMLSSSS